MTPAVNLSRRMTKMTRRALGAKPARHAEKRPKQTENVFVTKPRLQFIVLAPRPFAHPASLDLYRHVIVRSSRLASCRIPSGS